MNILKAIAVLSCVAVIVTATPVYIDEKVLAELQQVMDEAKATQFADQAKAMQFADQQFADQAKAMQFADRAKAMQFADRAKAMQFADRAKAMQFAETSQSGVTITGCGPAGDIVNAALTPALLFVPPGTFGVSITCTPTSTRVIVEAPLGTRHTDVQVNFNNGQVCVDVSAGATCPAFFPIPLPIPIQGVTIPSNLLINIFGTPCVSVVFTQPNCMRI